MFQNLPSDIKRRNAVIAKVKDSPPAVLTRKPGSHGSLDAREASSGKAQPSSTLAVDATPQGIDITFDPTAPLSSQFTFNNNSNSILNGKRYLPVAQQNTTITLGLKTQNGASAANFSPSPLNWLDEPSGILPGSTTFTVDPPPHYLTPWIFTVNINYGGVNNIMSPAFYLVKAPADPVALNLVYTPGDGSFQLLNPDDNQPVIAVAHQQILLNVLPATYQITLSGATFNTMTPIVWSTGTLLADNRWPAWISPLPSAPGLSHNNTVLTFSIPGPISGQSAGFQFAVDVNGLTVLSPDPIIINATIGDG
jgi:hypothetical protein